MISYDRRAPGELLEVIKDGWASSLAEYGGCGAFALDLQLRRNSMSQNQGWASLYVGLTKVLDLHYHPTHRFRLDVHPTWQEFCHCEHAWEDWFNHMEPSEWKEVEAYLESVIEPRPVGG